MTSESDGSYIELLEWQSSEAAGDAHENANVMQIWSELAECAAFVFLKDLKNSDRTFPHFKPVKL